MNAPNHGQGSAPQADLADALMSGFALFALKEPKQDGQAKNDCERNATKRFFEHFRADPPLRPRQTELIGGICHVDDAGVFGRPNAAAVLAVVPGSLEKDE